MAPMAPYSLVLSLGVLLVLSLSIGLLVGYSFSPLLRQKIEHLGYFFFLRCIAFLSITSTIAVMVYQLYYELRVCELCWWQRIFMFPIDIVVLVSLWKKVRVNHLIIAILASFGAFFAGYHYYYHFRAWVLGEDVILACATGGLLPACTEHEGVLTFGFITIPFMALAMFVSILIFTYICQKLSKNK